MNDVRAEARTLHGLANARLIGHLHYAGHPVFVLLKAGRIGQPAEQQQEQRFLRVHAIFGLIKDD